MPIRPDQTAHDLTKLPTKAALAYAVRCVRRVEPLYLNGKFKTQEHLLASLRSFDLALDEVEHFTNSSADTFSAVGLFGHQIDTDDPLDLSQDNDARLTAKAARVLVACIRRPEAVNPLDAADFAVEASYKALRESVAPRRVGFPDSAPDLAALAAADDYGWLTDWARASGAEAMTPVPLSYFSRPLWGTVRPTWWNEAVEEMQGILSTSSQTDEGGECSRLLISVTLGEFTPVDEVAEELAHLYACLNEVHIASGGSGLEIDDWRFFVRDRQPAEVV